MTNYISDLLVVCQMLSQVLVSAHMTKMHLAASGKQGCSGFAVCASQKKDINIPILPACFDAS